MVSTAVYGPFSSSDVLLWYSTEYVLATSVPRWSSGVQSHSGIPLGDDFPHFIVHALSVVLPSGQTSQTLELISSRGVWLAPSRPISAVMRPLREPTGNTDATFRSLSFPFLGVKSRQVPGT